MAPPRRRLRHAAPPVHVLVLSASLGRGFPCGPAAPAPPLARLELFCASNRLATLGSLLVVLRQPPDTSRYSPYELVATSSTIAGGSTYHAAQDWRAGSRKPRHRHADWLPARHAQFERAMPLPPPCPPPSPPPPPPAPRLSCPPSGGQNALA
eukprot:scaffold24667_cov58-Phaeocystis_antarctica.AAC.5